MCRQSASSATAVAAAVVAKTQKNFESKFILIYDEFSLVLLWEEGFWVSEGEFYYVLDFFDGNFEFFGIIF